MQLDARSQASKQAHRRPALILTASAILLAAVAGCHPNPGPDVAATVNGKVILRAELEKYYKNSLIDQSQQQQQPEPQPSAEQADIVRLNLLSRMIDDEIMQQRATKLNLVASDEDVNARLTEMKAPFTEDDFNKQLQARNLTLDDLKTRLRRELTQTKLLNKEIESKINITDADITAYYNAHKSDFNIIEPTYRIAQIVVSGNPPQQGASQPQRKIVPNEAEAHKEIDAIRARIQGGNDFGALAAQFSENANYAQNGGDMGPITETQLHSDPETYNAIAKLQPGQITDPVPVFDPSHKVIGYAIYKLLSREAAGQRDLSDPRTHEVIRQGLRDRKGKLLQTAYLEMLHDQAQVRNFFAEQILKEGTP